MQGIIHSCTTASGEYVVQKSQVDGQAQLSVQESLDGGRTWNLLPWKLTLRSRLWHGLFATWPPETIDRLFCEGNHVVLEFRDPWFPYEKPLLPWGLDQESLWNASYVVTSKRWRLRRIRHMDYDGKDRPP